MNEASTYKQILRYMDELHQDIAQLIREMEGLFGERGFVPLPSARSTATWDQSSSYYRPESWRAPFITRIYTTEDRDLFNTSLLCFIVLDPETIFPFPPMLCARVSHPPLSEREIYDDVGGDANRLRALAKEQSWWHIREERGWFLATPVGPTPVTYVRGYFLNLFDLVDVRRVIENIILPLTEPDANLDELLTIKKYSPVVAEESRK